jgi:hypothetical protein
LKMMAIRAGAEHEIKAKLGFGKLVARFPAAGIMRGERVAEKGFGLTIIFDQQVGLTESWGSPVAPLSGGSLHGG